MPSRRPKTFAYPVVYPNGAVIYCDTQEEQEQLRMSLNIYKVDEENIITPISIYGEIAKPTKTSKGALEELKFQVGNSTYITHDLQITTFKVKDSGLFETIEHDLEILNLIHEHPVQFCWLVQSKDYFDYSTMGGTTVDFRFSEKEYNLLREWLKSGKEAL